VAEIASLLIDGAEEPERRSDAAEVAREVNAAICELEDRLPPSDEHAIGFLCECGCLGVAPMPFADYRRGAGAWIEGHAPK
jgi:hypothetical protein